MGSVWEGRHASLGTRVAVKFIEAEYANSVDARQRFDNEARAAATIESKHAIQVYDHGLSADGRPYIVMELLVGEPLDNRVKRFGRLMPLDTARIIQQVCRALHRAHERGIIHRDLKPENIFLVQNPDDDEEIAKVLDFGIAKIKATPGALGISSGTKTGTLLGTPFFMSPEQARGLRNVDHRSDLWSLGVIVFRCLTGVLPFDGESLGDLLVKICTGPIPVPSQFAPDLPPYMDGWMAKALDREPSQRFQTAQELADALATVCGLSVRRGASSSHDPSISRQSGPYGQGAYTPHSFNRSPSGSGPMQPAAPPAYRPNVYEQPIPAATSAPFTASTPTQPASSKGLLVGMTAAGLAIGFVAVLYFGGVLHPKGSSASGATDPVPTAPTTTAVATATAPGDTPRPPATGDPAVTLDAGGALAPLVPTEPAGHANANANGRATGGKPVPKPPKPPTGPAVAQPPPLLPPPPPPLPPHPPKPPSQDQAGY